MLPAQVSVIPNAGAMASAGRGQKLKRLVNAAPVATTLASPFETSVYSQLWVFNPFSFIDFPLLQDADVRRVCVVRIGGNRIGQRAILR